MKNLILCAAVSCAALAASAAGAASLSMGSASGYPGEQVSVAVGMRGGTSVTAFEFGVQYDRGVMSYSGASLGSAAKSNGINRLSARESAGGSISVEAEASAMPPSLGTINGTVVTLKFTISSSASPGSRGTVRFSGGASVEISMTSNQSATTGSPGSVSVTVPPTPLPSGPPPRVDLGMDSPDAIVPGENAVLEYRIRLQDPSWEGVPSDAYLGVVPPTGGILYIGSRGRYYTKPNPIVRNLLIEEMDGEIDFGPMPAEYPTGIYTFYGVLTWPGMSPLKSSGRITDIDSTQFELLPTPTPTPAPTP